MPKHNHSLVNFTWGQSGDGINHDIIQSWGGVSIPDRISEAGSSACHNNLPKYQNAHIYYRY